MQESEDLILETERLVLRGFREEDLEAIQEYASDPVVVRYMPWGPNTRQDTLDFIHKVRAARKEKPRTAYDFVLVNRAEDYLIGACGLYIRSAENREGEIGYVLNRRYWNRGYISESARKLVSFGFGELGLHRIYATCDPDNTGSYRVMEKTGMRREGLLRECKRFKGAWRDSLLYSILAKDWHEYYMGLLWKEGSEQAGEVRYSEGDREILDLIGPLWEKLREHHRAVSVFSRERFSALTFEKRKQDLLEKSRGGGLHVVLALAPDDAGPVGYCVTSLDGQKQGEIESIYVEKDYRGYGIGDVLMKKSLDWLETAGAQEKILGVAEGNESVFAFYRRYGFYPRMTILKKK
ncbi:MAG: N-acetyltransferase [Dehalococcoidales bacterium]|nr:N-acetyltransferase [Dehalococcoidales bacterium]